MNSGAMQTKRCMRARAGLTEYQICRYVSFWLFASQTNKFELNACAYAYADQKPRRAAVVASSSECAHLLFSIAVRRSARAPHRAEAPIWDA